MKSITVKTLKSEFDFSKNPDKSWTFQEYRDVRCFRPGAYRTVKIKPIIMSKDEVKAKLAFLKSTQKDQVIWVKTK